MSLWEQLRLVIKSRRSQASRGHIVPMSGTTFTREQPTDEEAESMVTAALEAYEQGDRSEAERLYRAARERDPHAARRFREHLNQVRNIR